MVLVLEGMVLEEMVLEGMVLVLEALPPDLVLEGMAPVRVWNCNAHMYDGSTCLPLGGHNYLQPFALSKCAFSIPSSGTHHPRILP